MEILTVKMSGDGYLVNGKYFVPNDPANRFYTPVQDWIGAGNTPAPEYTQAELDEITAQEAAQAEDVAVLGEVRADVALKALLTATPAQIETWIDTNVTDMASAKVALTHLAKAVRAIGGAVIRG